MSTGVVNPASARELKKLLAALASGMSETIASLISREVSVQPGAMEVQDTDTILAGLKKPNAVVRAALDKDFAGKHLCALFEVQDASTMAGLLMMAPDDVLEQRRQRLVLEGEDVEAFGELGNVMCSGFDNVLREAVTNIGARVQDSGVVKPSLDKGGFLAKEPLLVLRFQLKVASYPATPGLLVIDKATAEKWNKAPLQIGVVEAPAAPPPTPKVIPADGSVAPRLGDEDEDIPQAEIRGVLNAFLTAPDLLHMVKRSCRRIGLELRRFGKADIPNPAAHRGEIVLIDIPQGDDRRFEWSKRIKDFDKSVRVVLLIHRPSRQRVLLGFRAEADALLGLPVDEQAMSQKLAALLDAATPR